MKTAFTKYHGLGNDFMVIERFDGGNPLAPSAVRWLCDRRRGVGADGVLSLWADPEAEARMQVQNADGSESGMCGNGLRCVTRYLYDSGRVASHESSVTVRAGGALYRGECLEGSQVRVSMGKPAVRHDDLPPHATPRGEVDVTVSGRRFSGIAVFMGNPHFVVLDHDEAPMLLAERFGAALERASEFRNRTNASFVRLTGDALEVVVFERGVGITQACGSGACAAAVAASRAGWVQTAQPITVRLPGGSLRVHVGPDESIVLDGEAVRVFAGEVTVPL